MCGAGFAQLNNLQKHVLTHVETDSNATIVNQFECTNCNETFDEYDLAHYIFAFLRQTNFSFVFVLALTIWKNIKKIRKC